MEMSKTRVAIIGAGIAGLSAAQHLYKNGLTDVVILEASDRVGGRIKTVKFGKDEDCVVELGANYLEGLALTSSIVTFSNEKELFNISESSDRLLERSKGYFYRSDGRAIEPELSSEIFETFEDWLDEEPDDNINLEIFYREKLKKYLKKQKSLDEYDADDINAILNYYMNYLKVWLGGPLKDMPFNCAGSYYEDEIPGGALKVGGLKKVIDALVSDLPENAIKINQEVELVEMNNGKVKITSQSGCYLETDHVIITCPLGYLKENASKMFIPELPQKKMEAIEKIGFGKIGKVFLKYKKPFWTTGSGRMSLAWKNEDHRMNSDKEWYKNIEAFDEVVDNPNVLVCWVANEGVDAIETIPEEELKITCTAVLRKFLQNPSIPQPESIIRTQWTSDRLYRGTYCYEATDTRDEHWEELEASVMEGGVPRLLFAGEAMRGNGCMSGARDSALREAEKLLKIYNLQKVPTL